MTTQGTSGFRLGPGSAASYGNVQGGQATAVEWVQVNPVLPLGMIGYESDTGRVKIGDGISDWNTLEYSFFPLNSDRRSTTGVDTTDDLIVDASARGLVLRDSAGPDHYWRVTVNAAGALVVTDLGTTKP
jgi:hypothetical protein